MRTFRDAVDAEEKRWHAFSRVLTPSRRARLARIFDYARQYADAGTVAVTPRVTEVVFLMALLGIIEDIEALESRVEGLEAELESQR